MSLYRVTLLDKNYRPMAVLCRHSDQSIQEFTDQIHSDVDHSHFATSCSGISVEIQHQESVCKFLQVQAS